jgi:undecaprenyl-diphosphatase
MRWVTRSADFSALWLATGALLATTRGRAGRRAAARGLLCVAVTSALVNGPAKSAFRRPRPSNRLVPVDRVRHRSTRTSSFPSGHSASAAAFAVGAGSELRGAAVPLGAMAALVGASRVRTGAHYPGDVVVGMGIGACVAVATRRVWPVPPREAALPHPARIDPVQARPTGKGIRVVLNSDAGSNGSPADVLRERLPDLELVEAEDLDEALARAREGADVIGAAGGDGTVNAVAVVALEAHLPLAVVPAGTLNHFARDIGLEAPDDTTEALETGSVADVDVGLIAGEVFLNTASLGAYVELVHLRERLEERIGKWPAAVVALGRVLRSCPPVSVELDGITRRVWMVFFGNCRYGPSGFAPSWRGRLDDGLVDVRVLDADVPHAKLRILLAVLTGTLGRCRAYEHWTAASVDVRSLQGPLRLSRDGEVFDGPAELTVGKADDRLRVYARAEAVTPA